MPAKVKSPAQLKAQREWDLCPYLQQRTKYLELSAEHEALRNYAHDLQLKIIELEERKK